MRFVMSRQSNQHYHNRFFSPSGSLNEITVRRHQVPRIFRPYCLFIAVFREPKLGYIDERFAANFTSSEPDNCRQATLV